MTPYQKLPLRETMLNAVTISPEYLEFALITDGAHERIDYIKKEISKPLENEKYGCVLTNAVSRSGQAVEVCDATKV